MVPLQVVSLGFWSQLSDLVQMRPDHVDFILQPVDTIGILVVCTDGVAVGAVAEVNDGVGSDVLDDRKEDV